MHIPFHFFLSILWCVAFVATTRHNIVRFASQQRRRNMAQIEDLFVWFWLKYPFFMFRFRFSFFLSLCLSRRYSFIFAYSRNCAMSACVCSVFAICLDSAELWLNILILCTPIKISGKSHVQHVRMYDRYAPKWMWVNEYVLCVCEKLSEALINMILRYIFRNVVHSNRLTYIFLDDCFIVQKSSQEVYYHVWRAHFFLSFFLSRLISIFVSLSLTVLSQ